MSHELNFQGVFPPPLLIVLTLSILATIITASPPNRYRLSRFFALPRLAFVVIYVVLIGAFAIRI